MIRNCTIIIVILLIFICTLTSPAQNTQIKSFQIKYLSAQNVYLDAGKIAGLKIGDRLLVKRDGKTIAEIEVKYLSDHSASCQIVSSNGVVKSGDKAILQERQQVIEKVQPIPVVIDTTQDIKETKISTTAPSSRRRRSPFSGTVSLQYYYWKDLQETQLDFSQPTLRVSLRGKQLWGKDYNIRIRARLRHNQRARSLHSNAPEQEWRNRIFEVSFSYDNINAPLNYKLGRIISNKFSGVGYIDGLLLQYNALPKFRFGLFGGSQPQWQYGTLQTSLQKYGAYFNYSTGNYSKGRFESTLAAAGEYHGNTVSREFIYFQNNFNLYQRWTVFQSAEVDINRSWRKDITGENTSLTNLFVSAQWRIIQSVIIGAMYDNRQNYLTYQTRTLADSLFDEALRQGVRGTLTLIFPHNYRLFGNFGIRKRVTDVETTKSFSGGLSKVNFLIPNLRIYINASGFSNFFTDGINYSILAGRYMGNRLNIDLALGGNQYSLKADNTNRFNQWIRINLLSDLIYRVFLSGNYEYGWGDDIHGHRFLFEIGYRL
jgi:hypothetical protein